MGVEDKVAQLPSKASGLLDKLTAKPPKDQEDDEILLLEVIKAANKGGDNDDNTSLSNQKQPFSSQLQARSRSGSGFQQGDLRTGSDTPAKVAGGSGDGEDKKYISGLPLFAIMANITVTCFIVLLDMSILGTVSSFFQDALHVPGAEQIRLRV
jgi:hypothetical protein